MGYKLISIAPNQFQLVLENEPDYISALPMAPPKIEAEITHGDWLLLVFAVWSSVDMRAIQTAVEAAKGGCGRFKLGIRPFDRHDEMKLWMPELNLPNQSATTILEMRQGPSRELFISSDKTRNPIWLLLKDGKPISTYSGELTNVSLDLLIEKCGLVS